MACHIQHRDFLDWGYHTFEHKSILSLRIAKEANLRCIKMKSPRVDDLNLIATGVNFYVYATNVVNVGWKVHQAICREGDDVLKIPPKYRVDPEDNVSLRTPFRAIWFCSVIENAVSDNPSSSYSVMKGLIKLYEGKDGQEGSA